MFKLPSGVIYLTYTVCMNYFVRTRKRQIQDLYTGDSYLEDGIYFTTAQNVNFLSTAVPHSGTQE